MARVGNGNGRQRAAIVAVASREFLGKVHGVAVRAAIAAGDDLMICVDRFGHQRGSALDGFSVNRVAQKVVQNLLGFG